MEKSTTTRKKSPKKDLEKKSPRVNDDALKLGGALDRWINYDKSHWPKPVTGSGVSCQLCWWDSGENIDVQVQIFKLCDLNLCVKQFSIFHMIRSLVEDR